MRYTDEWKLRESFEKWPPGWGDTIFGEDDEDEEEQENKRIAWLPARLMTIK
jgi:hypothetical protein